MGNGAHSRRNQTGKARKTGDRWLSDKKNERNAGRLLLRISPKGVKRFYFRYAVPGRDRIVLPLDEFTDEPKDGYLTLREARDRAAAYSAIHKAPESRDVRAHLDQLARQKAAEKEAERQHAEREADAATAARQYNVKALAAEYGTYLERAGKTRSAQDARNIFKNHLNASVLSERPAKDVDTREVTALLRGLVEADKGRTAAKLRSYLRAAYSLAIRAERDATAPSALLAFNVSTNPVAGTDALSTFTRERDRYLTEQELAAYWKRLGGVSSEPVRAALQLAILLGGQRIAQLLRLRRSDVDLSSGYLTLRDPKGKRKQPRIHELPISAQAMAILKPIVTRAEKLERLGFFIRWQGGCLSRYSHRNRSRHRQSDEKGEGISGRFSTQRLAPNS